MRLLSILQAIAYILGACSAQAPNLFDLSTVPWTVTSHNVSVPGKVPSQAHLDLLAAGVIEEPVLGDNDFRYAWIAYSNFTYTSGPIANLSKDTGQSTYLVFDGLNTIGDVFFCDQHVASVANQFRKWTFDVTSILANCSCPPTVKVAFSSTPLVSGPLEAQAYAAQNTSCLACYGTQYQFPGRQFIRMEQNDFGWDWSPGFAPQGIWKPARIVQVPTAPGEVRVEGMFADIYRQGQVNNLPPNQLAPFVVNASVDYIGALPNGTLMLAQLIDANGVIFWQGGADNVKQAEQSITGSFVLSKEPELWWPVGHGQQAMYNLTISLNSRGNQTSSLASVRRRVGFRTVVLNETPITAEQKAKGIADGDNWHFEVNGHEIYAKGSNFVPPDPFWPRVTKNDIDILFSSAVAANMNMLRLWSSSVYMPDFLYDLADEYGLLLWSELQFSDAFSPSDPGFVENAVTEVAQNVRRINHHPSLALWVGGNELQEIVALTDYLGISEYTAAREYYQDLFLDTLLHAVFDNTRSISYIGGSTTLGFESYDYNRSLPIEERYTTNLTGVLTNDIYGNQDFYSYTVSILFNESTYAQAVDSRFVNEFGFISPSSYETYAAYIAPDQLSFNSSMMTHRNRHNADNLSADATIPDGQGGPSINTNLSLGGLGQMSYGSHLYYPTPHKQDPAQNFSMQIYAAQIFQAEVLRYEIDLYRRGSGLRQRNMGSLYWQLNDIWAAPTWASLETGGRWKMLHHIAGESYKPVTIHPFKNDEGVFSVSVTSDLWQDVTGTASLTWYAWSGRKLNTSSDLSFSNRSVAVGAINSTQIFERNLTSQSLPNELLTAVAVLQTTVRTANGTDYSAERFYNPQFLSKPTSIKAFKYPQLKLSYDAALDEFVVESQAVAAFVWLSQPLDAKGYFSRNGFWMLPGCISVRFVPFLGQESAPDEWQKNVTVTSVWDLTTA